MENQISGIDRMVGKIGLITAMLSRLETFVNARQASSQNSSNHFRYLHHCIYCDCAMIFTDKICEDFYMACPDCSKNNRSSQGGS